jgi:fucose 4-O-acetylase-like acetyltransferase
MSNNAHIEWVDCAKGLAILLIIHLHVLNGLSGLYSGLAFSNDYVDFVTRLIRRFHMPFFFFLSGMFVTRSLKSRSTGEYILDKVYVILWPYVLWSLIQGVIQIYFTEYTNNIWTIQQLLYEIALDPIQQFWFIYVLFIYYMLYLILSKNIALALILALCMYIASYYITDTYYIRILRHLLFFLLGSVLVNNINHVVRNRYAKYMILPVIVILCVDVQFNITSNYIAIARLLLIIVVITMLIVASDILVKNNIRIFNYIGSIVLQIYLVHMLATAGTRILLHNYFNITDIAVHIISGTVMGLMFPILLVWIVNKYKIPYLFSLKRIR